MEEKEPRPPRVAPAAAAAAAAHRDTPTRLEPGGSSLGGAGRLRCGGWTTEKFGSV